MMRQGRFFERIRTLSGFFRGAVHRYNLFTACQQRFQHAFPKRLLTMDDKAHMWSSHPLGLSMIFSAASRVCVSNIAMVIGPTPPGTGVYAAHLLTTADSSISPTPPG